jgi:hypothetical protein
MSGNSTNSTHKKRYSDRKIIGALAASGGMVYLAAKSLGCDPGTIYKRAKENCEIQNAIDNARGEMIDAAETALKVAVLNREAWAVCFTLKTIGKERGYTERNEITGKGGEAIEIKATDYRVAVAPLAPRPMGDSEAPG